MIQHRHLLCALLLTFGSASDTLAQTAPNALGIYTDPTGDPASSCYDAIVGAEFMAYLVLTNPVNNEFDGGQNTARPIQQVSGFECRIFMPGSASFFVLEEEFAVDDFTDCQDCRPNYTVEFATPVPVIDNAVVLVSWKFLTLTTGTHNIFIDPTEWESQPSALSVIDAEDPQAGRSSVTSSSGSENVPVFVINPIHSDCLVIIPVTAHSWGHIKSLYR